MLMKKTALLFLAYIMTAGLFLGAGAQTVYAAEEINRQIPVLLYHHLLWQRETPENNPYIVTVEDFGEQMAYMFENGYTTIGLDDLRSFLYEKKPLPEKSFLITFDDGYYSNIQYAYPILKEYGFTAVIFLITRLAWDNSFLFVNPQPQSRITSVLMPGTEDVFEYATHTHELHVMVDGQSKMTLVSQDELILDIKESLKWVGNSFALAYPYGHKNDSVIEAIKEAGIELAFATTTGYIGADNDPHRLNRFPVFQKTALEQIIAYMEAVKN
jgi:peptidoglycan/xylan/chitin deacetylase (PgdA/CDA1 family)